jgi:hypothetical protein
MSPSVDPPLRVRELFWQELISDFHPGKIRVAIDKDEFNLGADPGYLRDYFLGTESHAGMRDDAATWYWCPSVGAACDIVKRSSYTFPSHPSVQLPRRLTWAEDPFESGNWRFYLHSLRAVEQLLGAFIETRQEPFIRRAIELVDSWIEHNTTATPPSDKSWHDHATANRLTQMVLLWQHRVVRGENDDYVVRLLSAIHLHAEILNLESFYTRHHNHGLCQAVSLLQAATAFPEFTRARAWRETALARLDDEARFGFTNEGVHRENSPLYHRYALVLLDRALSLLEPRAHHELQGLPTLIDRAYRYLAHAVLPNREFPLFGDTDTHHEATWMPDGSAGGREMAVPDLLQSGGLTRYSFTQGREGLRPADSEAVGLFQESGYVFLRDGWHRLETFGDTVHFAFKAAAPSAAHRHADILSFCLYGYGERWIVDPGTLWRREGADSYWRHLRGASAHNIVLFDGGESQRSRESLDRAIAGITRCDRRDEGVYVVASCHYKGIGRHRREILFFDRSRFFIRDTVDVPGSESEHDYEMLIQLAPDKRVSWLDSAYLVSSSTRGDVQLVIAPRRPEPFELATFEGQTSPTIRGWASLDGETLESAPVVSLRARGRCCVFETLICYRRVQEAGATELSDEVSEGFARSSAVYRSFRTRRRDV